MSDTHEPQWLMPTRTGPIMRLVGSEADNFEAEVSEQGSVDDEAGSMSIGMAQPIEESGSMRIGRDRREHRRFDIENWNVPITRADGKNEGAILGRIVDLSAGGIRLRTRNAGLHADQQVRVRLELPETGGVRPFVALDDGTARPTREWTGWLAIARVRQTGDGFDVAGRLVDMEAMDRGMLGLYLSTQPLAA